MATSTQVSHGLNLVLKLRSPKEMGALLQAIREAQPTIDAGLDELGFVHFARFLPTHDFSALQVITEFDGPLTPYVLDFAIEIGDVFDKLLSYTQGTEHLIPIREHPAEFLAFVEEHNRVLPQVPEWNLYSAYRDKTVLEIVGPRTALPLPKPDRAATPVQLWDVQGNILKGYRAERATHFLLEVRDPGAARAWLAARATPPGPAEAAPDADAKDKAQATADALRVTSAQIWSADARPPLMLNVGLTAAGMAALGLGRKWLDPFPAAFLQGALERAADNFDTGLNDPDHWWLGGRGKSLDTHLMVSLYQQDTEGKDAFDIAAKALLDSLSAGGLRLVDKQELIHPRDLPGLKFADGIAEPRVAGLATPTRNDLQPASTAGEFLLGAEYRNIYGGSSLGQLPAALASNGTFCAVRVIALDPPGFQEALESEAARLSVKADWLAAKMMGRWFNGAPVSLHPDQSPAQVSQHSRNDFDYAPSHEFPDTPMDHEGLRCPVGAHIRRVNARTSRIAGARYARRLMRRGMPYKRTAGGKEEHGLFGLFFCADLERQFEFIQRHWINGDRFAPGVRGTRDPFAGTPENGQHEFEIPRADGPSLRLRLPQFTFTRGSLYLFMPGLAALRNIDRFVDDVAPAPKPNPGKHLPVTPEPLLSFDTKKPEFQADPYPTFATFRKVAPVFRAPPPLDGWFVFRYDDVLRVCDEGDNFSAHAITDHEPQGLFQLDETDHGEVRNLIASAWFKVTANAKAMVDRSIAKTLKEIEALPAKTFNLVDVFARPVPRNVYFDILGGAGIPEAERVHLDDLARKVMKLHDRTLTAAEQKAGGAAGLELGGLLVALLKKARSTQGFEGSFLWHLAPLIQADGQGPLTGEVAAKSLVSMTVAGYMSVEFLLATGIRRLLLDDAAWWQRVQADPALLAPCLEEMRRCEHALSVIDRFARRDVEIGGQQIRAGERVFGVLASANRDERVYGQDADAFKPGRRLSRPHLGFGHGVHECMGIQLQKLIAEPAMRALMAAQPGLRLHPDEPPEWFKNFYFRSLDRLEVVMT